MFVKFGDKTKPLNVKDGKRDKDSSSDAVYTDDKNDRRANALKKSLEREEDEHSKEEK